MSQSSLPVRGLLDLGKKAASAGIKQGTAVAWGADEFNVVAATVAGQQALGPAIESGSLPTGAADNTIPDTVTPQLLGKAAVRVPNGATFNLGDQAVLDSSGRFVSRTLYSISQYVMGEFAQGGTAGANEELHDLIVQRYRVELVRQVSASAPGAPGAATKYLGAPGVALAAAQVVLYTARFAGETLRNLGVSLATAPGGADTVVFTVQKSSDNGATWTSTGLTATISAAGKSAQDLTHTFALAAGDQVAIQIVSSNVTAAGASATVDLT